MFQTLVSRDIPGARNPVSTGSLATRAVHNVTGTSRMGRLVEVAAAIAGLFTKP
jgi:hypothetical protein